MMEIPPVNIEALDNETVKLITFWGMRLITAIAILVGGWIIGKYLSRMINNIRKLDATLKSFLGGLVRYGVLAISIVAVLGQLGVQTASLLAVLGAAGLAIGLALQGTLSNVAAGVMLLILRPFNVGDYIEAGNVKGIIKDLGLFTTELNTPDNIFIFVPNSQLWSSEIYNFNRNRHRRLDIVTGISYGDDIEKAFKIIQKVLDADERLIRTEEKKPFTFVNALGASSVDIGARVWMNTTQYWDVRFDLTKAIKEALDKAGITIAFPTRTLEFSPESLKALKGETKDKKAA